jgi:hypothetical protein
VRAGPPIKMRRKNTYIFYLAFLLSVSFFGLLVSTTMLEQSVQATAEFGPRKMIVGFVYESICLAGTFAVLSPGLCGQFSGAQRSVDKHPSDVDARTTRIFGILLSHGHHPLESEESANHELRLGGKSFCASCFGLLTGALVSSITMSAFLFSDWQKCFPAPLLYFFGLGGTVLGMVSSFLSIGARVRFALGVVFVAGTCLMLIAMDVATSSLPNDMFVVLLSVFWVICRISISDRN